MILFVPVTSSLSQCPVRASKRDLLRCRGQPLHAQLDPAQAEAEPEAESGGQNLGDLSAVVRGGVQRRGGQTSRGDGAVSADDREPDV